MHKKTKNVINPNIGRHKPRVLGVNDYMKGILSGDRTILGRAITLLESTRVEHIEMARELIEKCLPYTGKSFRMGITGTPGVGKSSFIEVLGQHLLTEGRKIAVLAVDPSSRITKGSILGDKTRMEILSRNEAVFIRPSAAGESLGGVAQKTRESILLCEAAGYDTIIIETVGVGQSETVVHSMVDFFLLLLLPGAGDELQGIKRGVMEMADLVAVNKSDGDRILLAEKAVKMYQNALHLFIPKPSQWIVDVLACSAQENEGIIEIWKKMQTFQTVVKENGYFEENRQSQTRFWLFEYVNAKLKEQFYKHPNVKSKLTDVEKRVLEGKISSFKGGDLLLDFFRK